MKFDIIIGNPPYNNDLYLDFVQAGYEALKPDGVMVMLTPATWTSKYGQTEKYVKLNKWFRDLSATHMTKCIYYPDQTEVFSVSRQGGICYHDTYKTALKQPYSTEIHCIRGGNEYMHRIGRCTPVLDMTKEIASILDKVDALNEPKVTSQKSQFIPCLSWNSKCSFTGDHAKPDSYDIESSIFLVDDKHLPGDYPLAHKYIKDLSKTNLYQLVHSSYSGNVCRTTIVPRGCVTVDYYTTIFAGTKEEVKNAYDYYNCRLIWFLVYYFHGGAGLSGHSFEFVPDPGAFDHPFKDRELYEKYGLTDDEIAIIESVIKERK